MLLKSLTRNLRILAETQVFYRAGTTHFLPGSRSSHRLRFAYNRNANWGHPLFGLPLSLIPQSIALPASPRPRPCSPDVTGLRAPVAWDLPGGHGWGSRDSRSILSSGGRPCMTPPNRSAQEWGRLRRAVLSPRERVTGGIPRGRQFARFPSLLGRIRSTHRKRQAVSVPVGRPASLLVGVPSRLYCDHASESTHNNYV